MKIILSNDEIRPALEKFRATQDPDNTIPLSDIINNLDNNRGFVTPLLKVIMSVMFFGEGDIHEEEIYKEEDIDDWLEYTFVEDIFFDNIIDMQVIGETCDLIINLK